MPSPSTSSLDRPRCSEKLSSCSGFAWNVPSNAFANFLFHSEKQQVDSRMLSKFSLTEHGCGRAERALPAANGSNASIASGRGLAAVWLVEVLPREALPRWQEIFGPARPGRSAGEAAALP